MQLCRRASVGAIFRLALLCSTALWLAGCYLDDRKGCRLIVQQFYPFSSGDICDTLGGAIDEQTASVSATATPGDIVFIGGLASSAGATVKVEIFQASTATFLGTGSLANARAGVQAVAFASGPLQHQVLVASGDKGTLNYQPTYGYIGLNATGLYDGEIYNATVGTFHTTGLLPAPRLFYTATLLKNGMVLIAGGFPGFSPSNTAQLYDPVANTYTATAGTMQVARAMHTATLLPSGRVLLAGGVTDQYGTVTSTAELYDPASKTFTLLGEHLPGRVAGHTATLISCGGCSENGKVLLAGGFSGIGTQSAVATETSLNKVALYNPATRTFTAATSMHTRRVFHTATALADGKVLFAGGMSGSATFGFGVITGNSTNDLAISQDAELYDPAHGTMTCVGGTSGGKCNPSLKYPRVGHTATLVTIGKLKGHVLLAGGSGNRIAEAFDSATGKFSTLASGMKVHRVFQAAVAVQ